MQQEKSCIVHLHLSCSRCGAVTYTHVPGLKQSKIAKHGRNGQARFAQGRLQGTLCFIVLTCTRGINFLLASGSEVAAASSWLISAVDASCSRGTTKRFLIMFFTTTQQELCWLLWGTCRAFVSKSHWKVNTFCASERCDQQTLIHYWFVQILAGTNGGMLKQLSANNATNLSKKENCPRLAMLFMGVHKVERKGTIRVHWQGAVIFPWLPQCP